MMKTSLFAFAGVLIATALAVPVAETIDSAQTEAVKNYFLAKRNMDCPFSNCYEECVAASEFIPICAECGGGNTGALGCWAGCAVACP